GDARDSHPYRDLHGVECCSYTSASVEWSRRLELHQPELVYKTSASLLCHAGMGKKRGNGVWESWSTGRAFLLPHPKLHSSITPSLHFPIGVPAENRTRDSTFARSCDDLLHHGNVDNLESRIGNRRLRTADDLNSQFEIRNSQFLKLVARDGVAPPHSVLQTDALLRELSSHEKKSFRAVTLRGLSVIGRPLC